MEKIKLFNAETLEIIDSELEYFIDNNDKSNIVITTKSGVVKTSASNYFIALSKIRKRISPLIPMILGTQKYIFFKQGGYKMCTNQRLGEYYNSKKLLPFYAEVLDNNFASPKEQIAYIKLYQMSFNDVPISEFGLKENLFVFEKVPKFIYNPDKVLNKEYQYFWIYDHINNKLYDIKNEEDIEKFKNGTLLNQWNSLDDFLEYYSNNL